MSSPVKDDHDPFNVRRPEVFEIAGWRKLLFHPISWALILYLRSIRFKMDKQMVEAISAIPHPRMFVMWHNRSFLSPEVFRKFLIPEKTAALISPSRMAAWQVAFFKLYNFIIVRGSTTRRSVQAGIELLRVMREGADAGISPDGPSGPLYVYQEGSVAIARKISAPVIILVPNCRMAMRSNNWDRTLWPMPFARVEVQAKVVQPDDPLWTKSNAEVASELRRLCLELTEDPFTFEDHG
ncbi:MAG: lysophospholipid acyltransferase family protein [Puniceicoccaceae bacterium]